MLQTILGFFADHWGSLALGYAACFAFWLVLCRAAKRADEALQPPRARTRLRSRRTIRAPASRRRLA